ncbi:ATP-binding protein [Candidatus Kuenenbacteria bacterium]|nr:ATP-binding protein [Candidatus Kuenenbacteria bacterium]
MYIKRDAQKIIQKLIRQYPAIVLTGPRQSGKSTLAKHLLPNVIYASLEDLDEREFARSDPRGFLKRFEQGGIIDEIQKSPELMSYLQSFLDNKKKKAPIILTGSAQLTLLANVSQTLAGRTAIIELLPLSYQELKKSNIIPASLNKLFLKGFYPRLYKEKINQSDWYQDYVKTYIERDLRDLLKIHNLGTFQRFLKMCAGRAGQILNLSSLANDCGISHSTALAWLNILEATYIIFRLEPHYKNFSKRLIKSPKLFFYDTGLLCFLLGAQSAVELETHLFRGAIMENWVAIELIKTRYNIHKSKNCYFWRDNKGNEIDFIIEHGQKLIPIEIKSGLTVASDFLKNIAYWSKLAGNLAEKGYLIYGGEVDQFRANINILGWKSIEKMTKHI